MTGRFLTWACPFVQLVIEAGCAGAEVFVMPPMICQATWIKRVLW